jgi:transcriptional regulator with XRE-family HTH domain
MNIDSTAFYKDVGHRVRMARQSRRLTQDAVASRLSLKRGSITNIERGRQQLLAHTLMQLADVLCVSISSLLPTKADAAGTLTAALKARPEPEQKWIRAAIGASDDESG